MKENKYDDERFFEQYSQMPRSKEGLEAAGEWHILRTLLPDMTGKRVLDLGCGYGWHCKYAVEKGATHVTGIDLSRKMIRKAQEINPDPRIEYRIAAIEDVDYRECFDIVFSSLTLHYIESFDQVCKKVAACLEPGGEFIFSVEHPVFTASGTQEWYKDDRGHLLHWPVDNYFTEGIRHTNFLGERVLKYHRTLTTYVHGLLANGFELTALTEPQPDPGLLDRIEGMRDELRRPMMLIVTARKK